MIYRNNKRNMLDKPYEDSSKNSAYQFTDQELQKSLERLTNDITEKLKINEIKEAESIAIIMSDYSLC